MARKITDDIVRKIVRPREAHLHKGDCGRVLIGAGSVGMAGAAILASRGALRAGAGLVRVAVPRELTTILQIAVPEATCIERASAAPSALAQYDAICIGPGLGESAESIAFVKAMLSSYGGVLVVDADALNIIAHNDMLGDLRARAEHYPDTTIITPHIGEARRLLAAALESDYAATSGTAALQASPANQTETSKAGTDLAAASAAGPDNQGNQKAMPAAPITAARTFDFTGAASEAARLDIAAALVDATRATVILKGSGTIVAALGREPLINTTGNPGMATGGSGDVLAGVITGLAAQKRQPATAALQASPANQTETSKAGTDFAAASAADAESCSLQDDNSAATAPTRIGAYLAAVAAIYIHGRAGDLAEANLGEYGLIAGDLPLYVAHAIHELTTTPQL